MFTRSTRWVLAAGAAALTVHASWLLAGWGGPGVTRVVDAVGSLLFSIFASACCAAVAVAASGRRRVAWAVFTCGLLAWVVGDAVWAHAQLTAGAPPTFPSALDVAYLMLPVAMCAAWILNTPTRALLGLRAVLDGLIVASALFLVSWWLLLSKIVAQHDDGDTLHLLTAFAYPVGDIVVVTVGLVALSGAAAGHRSGIALVTSGTVAIAATDGMLLYLDLSDGDRTTPLLGIGWATGLLLLAAGALNALGSSSAPAMEPTRQRVLFWLPYAPMPLAAVVGVRELWTPSEHAPVLIAGLILVTAALTRQFTVLIDNRNLLCRIAEEARRDHLTGLPNRMAFTDRLDRAMRSPATTGNEVAVIALDLDDFKLVNDNLGHPAGDAMLCGVARRLAQAVPPEHVLARFGGDEFAVLVVGGPQEARHVAQRVVEAFDRPFVVEGDEIYMHPSVGLAITSTASTSTASTSEETPVDADDLLKRADVAMYAAKRSGVGGVHPFTPELRHADPAPVAAAWQPSGRRHRGPTPSIQLLGDLRRAIDDDALVLVYQPKVSLSTGSTIGVEALVRWPHPTLGMLTPNQFLPLVRQNGLMNAVTDLVVDHAVRDARGWYRTDHPVPVAINLFAPSLSDRSLPDRLIEALDAAGLPPAALSVEITEHLLLANIRRAADVTERLRGNGIRVAIDDFGSGYSTMSYLRDLAIDELKLDRQFIAPVLRSERAAAIVRSVIDLAHALGIACVAEGVEDHPTADLLREYGCDVAQGHHFARPMPARALLHACRQRFDEVIVSPLPADENFRPRL